MTEKIVAPIALSGHSVELTLDYQRDELEKLKQAGPEDGSTVAIEIGQVPPPKIALPSENLNCWSLAILESDPLLDARVRALLPTWDFHLVEIPVSFRPGEKTRIVSAVLEVTLEGAGGRKPPRVYRIIPEQVTANTKEKTEFGLDPSLEVKDMAKVSLGRWIKTVEVNNLKPRVTGFWQEHSAAWELGAEKGEGVLGTKVFYLVVQKRKLDGHCSLSLNTRAKVETRFGLFFTRNASFGYTVKFPGLL
jgi:hypothetical protein